MAKVKKVLEHNFGYSLIVTGTARRMVASDTGKVNFLLLFYDDFISRESRQELN